MKKHRPKPRKPKRRSAPATQPGLPTDGPGYYHGGQPDLQIGDYILPAAEAGTVQQDLIERCENLDADYIYDTTVAYVTADPDFALLYAVGHRSGRGELYEVEPEGNVTRDLDTMSVGSLAVDDFAYRCDRARIVRKIKIAAPLRQRIRGNLKPGVTNLRAFLWLRENGGIR